MFKKRKKEDERKDRKRDYTLCNNNIKFCK